LSNQLYLLECQVRQTKMSPKPRILTTANLKSKLAYLYYLGIYKFSLNSMQVKKHVKDTV